MKWRMVFILFCSKCRGGAVWYLCVWEYGVKDVEGDLFEDVYFPSLTQQQD